METEMSGKMLKNRVAHIKRHHEKHTARLHAAALSAAAWRSAQIAPPPAAPHSPCPQGSAPLQGEMKSQPPPPVQPRFTPKACTA